jgi:hypothetical protein
MYDTEYRELQRRAADLEEPLPDREYEVAWFKPNGRIATDKVIRLDPKPQILPRALDPKLWRHLTLDQGRDLDELVARRVRERKAWEAKHGKPKHVPVRTPNPKP